jgi:Tfp pilus assembly protein PilO
MKNSNYIALLVAISVVVILVGGLAVKKLGTDFLHNQRIITQKNKAQTTLSADVISAKAITNQYQTLGSQTQTIHDALPTENDLPGLANAVEAMGTATGASLTDVNDTASTTGATTAAPATGANSNAATALPVSIGMDVSYTNLDRFLAALESSVRPIQVSSIQLAGTNASLVVTVNATTYYQPPVSFKIGEETVK